MSPTPRAAVALGVLAVAALVVPAWVAALAAVALVAAVVVDALSVRRAPEVDRQAPAIVARGAPAPFRLAPAPGPSSRIRLRQPLTPDVRVEPPQATGVLQGTIVGVRRGRHPLPAPAARVVGPLGLGAWTHRVGADGELLVYPDLPGARRLATQVRQGRFRAEGRRRGPLGLGTEFESVREYAPDDDVRQVNWLATARLGRPMSNQFRVERDRDVILLVDVGRLMGAPVGDRTRLDVALDAAVAVATVAEELSDRCGAIAFDDAVRRSLRPRRAGARDVVQALYDLEPTRVESDYARAFREVGEAKRAFVLVLTDLLEETAARPIEDALPVLARRHAVAVASVRDPDLDALVRTAPQRPLDVYRASVALDVLGARERAAARLRRASAEVVEAAPAGFAAACVRAYLRAKARALL